MRRPVPALGPAPALPGVGMVERQLENGLRIAVVERRGVHMVDVELIMRPGAESDSAELAGRTSLMMEMLDEGTPSRSAVEIAEQIDYLGAHLGLQPGWDANSVVLHVLGTRLDAAFQIFSDVVLNASFPDHEFAKKRKERLTALQQECDEAATLAAKAMLKGVFGAHPYGSPLGGTYECVQVLTNDSVRRRYHESAAAADALFLIVGDIDAEHAFQVAAQEFSSWNAGAQGGGVPAPPMSEESTRVLLVHKPGAAQAELRVGHAGPCRNTPDYFALVVANTLLGGSFTSRLNTILREKMGVTYGASSRFRFRRAGGIFSAGGAVSTESVARSAQVVIEEMERMQEDTVGLSELHRAQNYLTRGLPGSFETTEDVAAHVREQLLYGLGHDYWQKYVERVAGVTPAAVRDAAIRHFRPKNCTITVVADENEVRVPLERAALGEVIPTTVQT